MATATDARAAGCGAVTSADAGRPRGALRSRRRGVRGGVEFKPDAAGLGPANAPAGGELVEEDEPPASAAVGAGCDGPGGDPGAGVADFGVDHVADRDGALD